MRPCPKCQHMRRESSYNRDSQTRTGRSYICAYCERQRKRAARRLTPDERAKVAAWYADHGVPR